MRIEQTVYFVKVSLHCETKIATKFFSVVTNFSKILRFFHPKFLGWDRKMGEGRQGEGEAAKQRLTDGGKEFGNTLTATSTNEQNCHHLLDDFKTRSSDPLY